MKTLNGRQGRTGDEQEGYASALTWAMSWAALVVLVAIGIAEIIVAAM